MKEKNKPDNLEKFFQRVLGEYEEDPGVSFWDRIAAEIPAKPTEVITNPRLKNGWSLLFAFVTGIVISSLFFYWLSNNRLFSQMETQITEKNELISKLETELIQLKSDYQQLLGNNITKRTKEESLSYPENSLKSQRVPLKNSKQGLPETIKSDESFIKLEIARQPKVVAAASNKEGGMLQPFYFTKKLERINYSKPWNPWRMDKEVQRIWMDKQLITNSFFEGNYGIFKTEEEVNDPSNNNISKTVGIGENDQNSPSISKRSFKVNFEKEQFLTLKELRKMNVKTEESLLFSVGDDGLTSFITTTMNPFSGPKYNLKGYRPSHSSIIESAGITSSWNWSVTGGFETKTKWSVQVGFDYNKLIIAKESINNVRFKAEDARLVNGGYVYSFSQRSDGALGQVSVSSTIFNQHKHDGQDVEDGDLFKLSVTTEQPVKIIRVPILGGYRFDLSKRFYATPKLGFSAVWKTKDQTQLQYTNTFSDRLSIQHAAIFLTTKTTTESLEANFRTEFGFRWRPRWYLVAEPRFKYSGKSLFQYKDLELRDAPFHLMLGIRFNVD